MYQKVNIYFDTSQNKFSNFVIRKISLFLSVSKGKVFETVKTCAFRLAVWFPW